MKKMFIFTMIFAVALAFGSNVFAANVDNEANPGTSITVQTGTADELVFNFSPSVVGQYVTDDVEPVNNHQWFALCTYHGGGKYFYGVTQTDTSIYKKERDLDQLLADAAIPMTIALNDSGQECGDFDGDTTTPDTCQDAGWTDGWIK